LTFSKGGVRKAHAVNGWIGVTDNDWFASLSRQPGIDEVKFPQPGGEAVQGAQPRKTSSSNSTFLIEQGAANHGQGDGSTKPVCDENT